MSPDACYSPEIRILGALWGALVGDALGVPVEFLSRADVRLNPVTGLRGYGSHRQPPGTWSDDSSLILCTTESLVHHEFDTGDMGRRFVAWRRDNLWTPRGTVFDIGVATSEALVRIAMGIRAELAGGDNEFSNGNGSLMRILPVSLRFSGFPTREFLDRVHRASAITHRHPRSLMACGFYSLVIRELLAGMDRKSAIERAARAFQAFYEPDAYWAIELDSFQMLLSGDLEVLPEVEIDSSGYVVHTLTASLWCFLTTGSFAECALKAVNLGGDTDTTGCVAGGLAGVCYGLPSIPENWRQALARHDDVDSLFGRFSTRKLAT